MQYFVSVNFNYGEHERNRIKRRDEIKKRMEAAGVKIINFDRLSFVFDVDGKPPKNINRLARIWQPIALTEEIKSC